MQRDSSVILRGLFSLASNLSGYQSILIQLMGMTYSRLLFFSCFLISGAQGAAPLKVFVCAQEVKIPKINQEKFLKAHNYYRGIVKVPPLSWSDALATTAQSLADSIAANHCTIIEVTDDFGESAYWCAGTGKETEIVDFWASERKHFDKQGHTRYLKEKQKLYGHYTQIVWATTTQIGVGRQHCDNGKEIWICLYDPAGNKDGQEAY